MCGILILISPFGLFSGFRREITAHICRTGEKSCYVAVLSLKLRCSVKGMVLFGWGIQGVFYAGDVCSMAMFMLLVAIGK
jgi:hypothetical protein